jgi:cardiolipin synthase
VKLIIEPADGVEPLLAAIKKAKKSIDIAIFRFDRKDVEAGLKAAAARGVRVTALIAFASRGGEKSLRKLELRFLEAGIIVARTADDLTRYHDKYMLIDRRVLYVLSFNFTTLDIGRSRGFGIVTTRAVFVTEAAKLFKADCTRIAYKPKSETFVVSPANSRQVLAAFLKRAKTQLLIYDPKISDTEMLGILNERVKAGVDVKVIGQVSGRGTIAARKLAGMRLHTRTIIRDRRQAFVGSQSLRLGELDARRELGLVIHDSRIVRTLASTFDADWGKTKGKSASPPAEKSEAATDKEGASPKEVATAVKVFTKELAPLATTVKKAVRLAVVRAGEDVLHDDDVKATMKKVVKQAVKEAVKDAVHAARAARPRRKAR